MLYQVQRAKVCRYNWHSAGSIGWPFPVLKYKYIFAQTKCMVAILSNSTQKQLWFAISRILIAVLKNRLIVSFIIISAHFRSYRPRCLHGHAFVTGRLCLSLRSNQIKFQLYYGFIHRISIFVYFGLLYRVGKKVRQQTHDHNCVKS